MFGNKKKNSLEEIRRSRETLEAIAGALAENSALYEAGCAETESSRRQMEADMSQVMDNLQVSSDMVGQNIRMGDALCDEFRETRWEMEQSEQEYQAIAAQLRRQTELFLELVEQNKHFTSPSKYLSENSTALRQWSQDTREKLSRMGETEHPVSLEELLQEFEEADKRIAGLEEQIRYLVALLKENNISTGKLLKENQTTVRMVERASIRPYSGDVAAWREQLLGIRNAEEEVLKAQERSGLLVGDIASELATQRRALNEISDEMVPIFEEAKEYMK